MESSSCQDILSSRQLQSRALRNTKTELKPCSGNRFKNFLIWSDWRIVLNTKQLVAILSHLLRGRLANILQNNIKQLIVVQHELQNAGDSFKYKRRRNKEQFETEITKLEAHAINLETAQSANLSRLKNV